MLPLEKLVKNVFSRKTFLAGFASLALLGCGSAPTSIVPDAGGKGKDTPEYHDAGARDKGISQTYDEGAKDEGVSQFYDGERKDEGIQKRYDLGTDASVDVGLIDGRIEDAGPADDAEPVDAGTEETREVIPGTNGTLIRGGMVVTADEEGDIEVIERGEVFIPNGSNTIDCVGRSGSCEGTERATVIQLASTDKIYPGLIDSHNHVQYNFSPLFVHVNEDGTPICYEHNSVWQGSGIYDDWKNRYSRPNENYPANNSICEEYHYGFAASLFGGASSVQGVGVNRRCFRQGASQPLLGRLLDSYEGIRRDHILTWTMGILDDFFLPDESIQNACENIDSGEIDRIYIHIAEGQRYVEREEGLVENPWIRDEFNALYARPESLPEAGCLMRDGRAASLVFIHGNFTQERLETLAESGDTPEERPKFVWSPNSNTDLHCWTIYATPLIPDILELGFTISLAPDWRPSHGTGMITEINAARQYARYAEDEECERGDPCYPPGAVNDEELFKMATINAAKVAALSDYIGRLAPGMRADATIVRGRTNNPFEPAYLGDISGVMINGILYYGDRWLGGLMEAMAGDPALCEHGGPGGLSALNICGAEKKLCIPPTVDGDIVDFSWLVSREAFIERLPEGDRPYTPESFDTLPGTCRP